MKNMEWSIEIVKDNREYKPDTSGVYTLINYKDFYVRLDVFLSDDKPLKTFLGTNPDAIRKAAIDWFNASDIVISSEHATYIGSELVKCSMQKAMYIQD